MKYTDIDKIKELQQNPLCIRNICIVAHVDHGKTTLADSLIASNGIISQRMTGKVRYLDSRPDEQTRGITMKSSSIALHFISNIKREYLINIVDSPGHVDFSSEVSTAVRICDGAIVVVDVVEGVCPQTHAVLRQIWMEGLKPVLVLNKIDRLFLELKLTAMEAFVHLQNVLEQVNAICAELFTRELISRLDEKVVSLEGIDTSKDEFSVDIEDDYDKSKLYFHPALGNVTFASSFDGWAFRVADFALILVKKYKINPEVLKRFLWGDFYINSKTKRIMKGAHLKGKKPLFVQMVLENLWTLYEVILQRNDKEQTAKLCSSLGVSLSTRDMNQADPRSRLQVICSQWLSLSRSVLAMVVETCPSPMELTDERIQKLICTQHRRFEALPKNTKNLKNAFLKCSARKDVPVVAFVSKMFPVDEASLPQNRYRPLTAEELERRRIAARTRHEEKQQSSDSSTTSAISNCDELTFQPSTTSNDTEAVTTNQVAFARVFSGSLRKGQKLYVLGPKYEPKPQLESLTADDHVTECTVNTLYLLMGKEMEFLDEVPAGNVCGIGGLEDHIIKSATISSTLHCPAFTDMHAEAMPIVRVAVEPVYPSDTRALVDGMKMLNQADPCVQTLIQKTGENVLIAAGEMHLQKCIDDLKERYAKVELTVSDPIVPFRETIVPPPKIDMADELVIDQRRHIAIDLDNPEILKPGLVEVCIPSPIGVCKLRIRALPLPIKLADHLDKQVELLTLLHAYSKKVATDGSVLDLDTETLDALLKLQELLNSEFDHLGKKLVHLKKHIWSFGPQNTGPNVLINGIAEYKERPTVWAVLDEGYEHEERRLRDYDNAIVNGFQLATSSGPICEEPMMGVAFVVEEWCYVETEKEASSGVTMAGFSGNLMYTMKETCRKAFQSQHQRLMLPMYSCEIQVTGEVLGKLYAVIGQRNGQVISAEMREGSNTFLVETVIPVVESFGLTEVVRKKTSGLAGIQLKFSHWEILDMNPYWKPTTDEEMALFGDKGERENVAAAYMNRVRKRKGLRTTEKLVEFAEKQRTLTKNK